jgi:hypothetical protein
MLQIRVNRRLSPEEAKRLLELQEFLKGIADAKKTNKPPVIH